MLQVALLEGAARSQGFALGPSALDSGDFEGWEGSLEAAYREGWFRGQRHRWRAEGNWPPPYLPEAMP